MLPASARPRGDTGAHTPERKDSRRVRPDRARFRPRRSSRLSPTPVLNDSDRLRLSRAMPPCTAPQHLVAVFLSRVFAAIDPSMLCNAVTAVNAGNQVDASLAVLRRRGGSRNCPAQEAQAQMGNACEMLVAAELTLARKPGLRVFDFWPGYDVVAQPRDGRSAERVSVNSTTFKPAGRETRLVPTPRSAPARAS